MPGGAPARGRGDPVTATRACASVASVQRHAPVDRRVPRSAGHDRRAGRELGRAQPAVARDGVRARGAGLRRVARGLRRRPSPGLWEPARSAGISSRSRCFRRRRRACVSRNGCARRSSPTRRAMARARPHATRQRGRAARGPRRSACGRRARRCRRRPRGRPRAPPASEPGRRPRSGARRRRRRRRWRRRRDAAGLTAVSGAPGDRRRGVRDAQPGDQTGPDGAAARRSQPWNFA